MRKTISKGILGGLLTLGIVLALGLPVSAIDKEVAENPLLRYNGVNKPAVSQDIVCDVGSVQNRITNSTVEVNTGTNDWTILFGDDSAEQPSMLWLYPSAYEQNLYLYFGSFRIGRGDKLVHLSTDTSPGMDSTSINYNPSAVSHLDTYFEISDQSALVPDVDRFNIEVHAKTYAWSETYRDDFIIYDFEVINLNSTSVDSIYMAIHMDCDISGAGGGGGTQGFWRDDKPGYYRDDATKEYISYMYDDDNPTIAGDDTGGKFLPKESTGYIGSRLLYCPPVMGSIEETVQSGHGWWDWNSDPGTDSDWMLLMSNGQWLDPPPSPHDFRYLQKFGPFEIAGGDSARLVFAFGLGDGLSGLRANLAWADSLLKLNWVGPSAPTTPEFTLVPGDRQVELTWGDAAETTPDPATGVYDFEGYRVWRRTGVAGGWTLLMECDLVNQIGHNSGLVHSYTDTDVNNGFQYSYVVTAFDKGEPENGIESFESGKGGFQTVEPGILVGTGNEGESDIHVVPNPFVKSSPTGFGFAPDQNNPSEERILFVNLPAAGEATVTIFSLTGDEVISLQKDPGVRALSWDLITKSTQKIVAGMYLYVVESSELSEDFVGKFMVVR
ncbi:MAG: hypothetical protein V3W18_04345 [candidate division Zixibacteria bacterium]